MIEAPLAEQLEISKEEVVSTRKKFSFMLSLEKEGELKEENAKKIYDEWVQIAHRLKKGGQMIRTYEETVTNRWDLQTNEKYKKLCDLYYFLIGVIGFYELFFKKMLPKERYNKLLNAIMEVMTD